MKVILNLFILVIMMILVSGNVQVTKPDPKKDSIDCRICLKFASARRVVDDLKEDPEQVRLAIKYLGFDPRNPESTKKYLYKEVCESEKKEWTTNQCKDFFNKSANDLFKIIDNNSIYYDACEQLKYCPMV